MQEKDVERYLKSKIEDRGGLCLKWVSPGCTGVPDRIIILPGGIVFFVELKTTSGRLHKRQEIMIEEIRKRHAEVFVLDSIDAIDTFLRERDFDEEF